MQAEVFNNLSNNLGGEALEIRHCVMPPLRIEFGCQIMVISSVVATSCGSGERGMVLTYYLGQGFVRFRHGGATVATDAYVKRQDGSLGRHPWRNSQA